MNKLNIIQKNAEDMLLKLGLQGTVLVEDLGESYQINFKVDDNGILIGYHGENIESLGIILNQIIFKKTKEWQKIETNVGDYLEKRYERLYALADHAADKVKRFKQSVTMPYLSAKERRLIHIYLQNDNDVRTESVGKDGERRLVVFPV